MFSKLKYWSLLDIFEKEEDRRMARIQLNIIMFNCFLSLLVFFINLTTWQDQPLTIILILGYVLHLILFVLVIRKHLPASSFVLTTAYAFIVTSIATIGGGLHDYVVMMYPVIIMYAGLMLQKRGLIFATLLSFAGLGWLVFGEMFGWFAITMSHVADQTDLLVSLILVMIAAWMVYVLVSNMEYGLAQTWRELAERKRIENELRKFTRMVEQSPASIVLTDLDGNIEYVNPRFTQITGYGFDESLGKNPRILKTNRTPPETHRQLWDTIAVGKEWRGEFVNRTKDGSLYYESAVISPITDLNGTATHYLAVKEDITERKQLEQSLNEARSRLQLLGENLEEAALYVYSHDAEGQPHFEYMSAGMEKLTGIKTEDDLQDALRLHTLILPEYMPQLGELETKSKEDLTGFEMEVRQRHAVTGDIHWALLRSTPRRRSDGSTVWYGVQMDITERKRNEKLLEEANEQLLVDMEKIAQLKEDLREQAIHDPLTNLYNRRYLNETLMREMARAEREKNFLSVIISDIDYFKKINDTYGHLVGDKFLVEIASLLKSHARGSDIVCRYGGEEFLLVMPDNSLDSAANRAEEIRQKCAEVIIQHEGKDLRVTMSFGVATYPNHGKDAEEIIIKADAALYRAKAQGRNCTVVFE